jgi:hypothetical protein
LVGNEACPGVARRAKPGIPAHVCTRSRTTPWQASQRTTDDETLPPCIYPRERFTPRDTLHWPHNQSRRATRFPQRWPSPTYIQIPSMANRNRHRLSLSSESNIVRKIPQEPLRQSLREKALLSPESHLGCSRAGRAAPRRDDRVALRQPPTLFDPLWLGAHQAATTPGESRIVQKITV